MFDLSKGQFDQGCNMALTKQPNMLGKGGVGVVGEISFSTFLTTIYYTELYFVSDPLFVDKFFLVNHVTCAQVSRAWMPLSSELFFFKDSDLAQRAKALVFSAKRSCRRSQVRAQVRPGTFLQMLK
jgi:hypothetical protein